MADTAARFWSKVDKDGPIVRPELGPCWVWLAGTFWRGEGKSYGCFDFQGRSLRAHRVSWWLHHGVWPEQFVLHRCDTPACVNPGHLFLGSIADNNRDRDNKGRHRRLLGSSNGFAKLNESQVAEIKFLLASGAQKQTLARRFGVSAHAVGSIANGKTWGHVSPREGELAEFDRRVESRPSHKGTCP